MRLANKTAIVTGAGDGIGRGIALAFARQGASVAVCDIHDETVMETGRLLASSGQSYFAKTVDLTDHDQASAFVDNTVDNLGGLDILVNNAAIMPVSPMEEQDEAEMARILEVNLLAPAVLSKYDAMADTQFRASSRVIRYCDQVQV